MIHQIYHYNISHGLYFSQGAPAFMELTTYQWHQRYFQQAQWTRNIRDHIFSKVDINPSTKLLDVGCGTGVLEREYYLSFSLAPYAIDINVNNLGFAQGYAPNSLYLQADCLELPFLRQAFDITACHFLLLWIKESLNALREMVRVTRPDGFVLALAEPDYGGRIDFPAELTNIGTWQEDSLKNQGANPNVGRELRSLFHMAGLTEIEVGVLGGQWKDGTVAQGYEQEWEIIEADLAQNEEFNRQAMQLKSLDKQAWHTGQRLLYVPTFYAMGKVAC
jgi:ubiquinone/menaquinone biosynthesis C-methylase UbiE